jgi:replicative DNA helicase
MVSERFLLSVIKILASDNTILRRQLINIKRFLDVVDREYYSSDNHIDAMLITCDSLLDTKMKLGSSLKLDDIIFNINLLLPDADYEEVKNNLIIPQIQVAKTDSIETELSYISASLDQNLKFSYILDVKEDLIDLSSELTTCSYKDFPDVLKAFRTLLTDMTAYFRSTDTSDTLNKIMHTSDPAFYDYLYDTYEAIRNPSSSLQTGWVALNSALGPRGGFINKNLYIYHANTNSFKSALLLHIARMIKQYNAPKLLEEFKLTGKIPTILFIEAENDLDEDNERLYKMVAKKDIASNTGRAELTDSWKHTFDMDKETNPIDIAMLHVDARSLSVDDIDTNIDMLEEEGYHVIACLADYIGLIKPREEDLGKENRIQLKNIADDMLSLAKNRNIPVITAHQLNRSGGAILTNTKMQGGSNAVMQMSSEFVGESYGIEQAASWSMFIDVETHDGKRYLTCKRGKARGDRSGSSKFGLEYFVLEIKNGLIIEDDIYLPRPLYFEAIPNTDVNSNTNNGIGERGVIDIRDKPKTPPKGHTLTIKPSQETLVSSGISISDLMMDDWVSDLESGKKSFDECYECTNIEVGYEDKHIIVGSTEYVFA